MLAKGTILAGYRIDGSLGEGGMGVVYRATQLSLNRSVALKILSAEFGADKAFRERFRREGLLQAAIDHPHIVTVYDTGESEHGLFLVMRMVRGPTLKDMILARELDPGRSLRLLSQVADALDTAHDAGLTHRDVKPQNILIGARDHAYLADFGLTKAPDEAGGLTATGQFVGTIDYVSPEQIQGEAASGGSDIYALAGVLHECLVGSVPFPKASEAAVVYAHISDPPPRPTAERPELPAEIDEVIAKGMAKDPADRHRSPGELMREARRAFGDSVGHVPGPISTPEDTGVRGEAPATRQAGTPLPSPEELATGVTAASPVRSRAADPSAPTGVRAPAPAPAPASVPAPAARAETATRSRGVPLAAVAVALAVVAAVAGFLIGGSGSEAEPDGPALSSSASAGSLALSFPNDWERVGRQPEIPGLEFSQAIVLAPAGGGGERLVAGTIDGAGPTLLPEAFLKRLPSEPSRDDTVRLGSLQAYRYPGLAPRGAAAQVTAYAAPTTEGVAAVACLAPARLAEQFGPGCERVAATLEVSGAKPLPLGPREAYAKPVRAAFAKLDAAAGAASKRLGDAKTPSAQAAAAGDLADAYRAAATAIDRAPAGPYEQAAGARLVSALRSVADAYGRAASAARSNDGDAYATARASVRRSAAGLERAEAGLRRLGYGGG